MLSGTSSWFQRGVKIRARKRGCHLITNELLGNVPELQQFKVGLATFYIQHTSASLCLNENYDSDVPKDMEMALNHIVPEKLPYEHTAEGPDDMPAHVKSALIGASITVPVCEGKLALGTWQGIWLCEHRNHADGRHIMVTIHGLTEQARGSAASVGDHKVDAAATDALSTQNGTGTSRAGLQTGSSRNPR